MTEVIAVILKVPFLFMLYFLADTVAYFVPKFFLQK